MKLFDVNAEVMQALLESVESRDDDYVLYSVVAKNLGYDNIEDMRVGDLIKHIYFGELPSIECVGRIRRSVQECNEDLRGSLTTTERRKKNENKYYQFFRK